MTDLESELLSWAAASKPALAAVEMLIAQGKWLVRPDFLKAAVKDGQIDWLKAGLYATEAPASAGELAFLRIACSLADPQVEVPLSLITRLDGTNLNLVQQALQTARFGHPG